jgi:uncharacterized integral membrane protein
MLHAPQLALAAAAPSKEIHGMGVRSSETRHTAHSAWAALLALAIALILLLVFAPAHVPPTP